MVKATAAAKMQQYLYEYSENYWSCRRLHQISSILVKSTQCFVVYARDMQFERRRTLEG